VEERVVGGVRGAALFEGGEGQVEVEPLGDAEVEAVVALHGFEGEPVVPVAEILHAGDAVRERVDDGDVEGFAAHLGVDGRNLRHDERDGGLLADDAGGRAGGVQVDLAARGGFGRRRDSGGDQRGGVGDDDVAIGAVEDCGMAAGDGVDVGAGGQRFRRPFGVVPAGADDPLSGFGGGDVGLDAGEHVGEGDGSVQVDGEFLLAGGGDVGVGVVEAGHDEGSVEVGDLSVRAAQLEQVGIRTDGDDG